MAQRENTLSTVLSSSPSLYWPFHLSSGKFTGLRQIQKHSISGIILQTKKLCIWMLKRIQGRRLCEGNKQLTHSPPSKQKQP